MNQQPIISVVICTYNNADSLLITLQQLVTQVQRLKDSVEVIVIDNNSSDRTKTICLDFVEQSPDNTAYVFEHRQGLSHARNTGVTEAKGRYVLFTDDDAEIPSSWLDSYLKQIDTHEPDCLYSKIYIIWDQSKPWWFLPEYTPCFVGVDYGDQLLNIDDIHKEFYGKNFCLKKTLITELGGFDPALGRSGSKLIAGEETLLYRRMIALHKNVIYFPDAPVGHRLKEREYLAENIKKQFIDGAYSSHHIAKIMARKTILGRPSRALFDSFCTLMKAITLCIRYKISGDKPKYYLSYLTVLKNLTFIKLWVSSP